MPWATVSPDATFTSRMQDDIIYPADFLMLEDGSPETRACTHHTSVTDQDGNVWAGVGRIGYVKPAAAEMSAAAQRWEVGLLGLPVDDGTGEPDLVGAAAEIYLGNADANFENWKLDLAFKGFVQTAGKFEFRRGDKGERLMDVSLTLGDQRNPNRGVQFYHSINDGSAWKFLATVKESKTFPAD